MPLPDIDCDSDPAIIVMFSTVREPSGDATSRPSVTYAELEHDTLALFDLISICLSSLRPF